MRPSAIIAIVTFLLLGAIAAVLAVMQMPTRLRVAVGPDDLEHTRLMTTFARKLQADRAPVRLTLVRRKGYREQAEAVDKGEADLAVVRSDLMPRTALTVAVLHEVPVVFVVGTRARLRSVNDLVGKRVGVMPGTPENLALLATVLKQSGIDSARVTGVPLTAEQLASALDERHIDALMPIGTMMGTPRERIEHALHRGAKAWPVFGVDEAEAVVRRDPALALIEIPRGALLARPAVPAETLTTVAVTQRLVARHSLSQQTVAEVTRLLFSGRVGMADDEASAKLMRAPQTDTAEGLSATLPLHPGAAAYLSGDQQTFFDRYGDLFYIGSMLATTLFSGVGALISYTLARQRRNAAKFTRQLMDLLSRARLAQAPEELQAVVKDADALLAQAFVKVSDGAIGSEQFDTFATVNDSVLQAIERRDRELRAQGRGALAADGVSKPNPDPALVGVAF